MRERSLRESFLARAGMAVVLTVFGTATASAASDTIAALPPSSVPFSAQDAADPLDMNALLADIDLTTIEAADWKPEHAPTVEAKASTDSVDTKAAEKPAETSADKGVDASDPEPDGVVVPKTPSPSHDPLDKPAAAAPAKTESAKPATQTAEEPLPALNAAIKAAIDKRAPVAIKGANAAEQRKERDAVSFFYAAHGFAPAWSENGKPTESVAPVLSRLAAAGEDALTVANVPKDLKATGTPEEIAESDLVLTEAVVSYARQASGSRVEPRSISPLIGSKPDLADPAEVVDALIDAGSEAGTKLRGLNPADPRYVALRDKLAEIRGAPAPKTEAQIESGPVLTVGMSDPRVPLLRARLNVPANADGDDADLVYDSDLAAAIAKYQREKGLRRTGTLNSQTVGALNGVSRVETSSRLEGTIVANMEMWRWLPRDLGSDRIEVNIPDYLVRVFHDNEPVASHRVVVGKTNTPTPIFSNTMKFLIVNPVWNVPQSIIKNEFGGEARGFKARYVHGQLFLQQPAGPGNALGRIKFMFPNEYSVYLHDTPAKGLFGNSKRAYSHGCVRVDKPFEFAQSVLNDAVPEGGKILWNVKRLEKMLGTTERYVDLPKPLPIHIAYFTASVDASGQVTTREDIYGYTAAVATALGLHADGPRVPIAGTMSDAEQKTQRAERAARRHVAEERRARRRAREAENAPQAAAAPPSSPFSFFPF